MQCTTHALSRRERLKCNVNVKNFEIAFKALALLKVPFQVQTKTALKKSQYFY
jgi:hypothetical protein